MARDPEQFTGAPVSFVERLRGMFAPTGGAVADGLRLAAIFIALLVTALVVLGILAILDTTAGRFTSLPLRLPGFVAALVVAAIALVISRLYATAHRDAARRRRADLVADRFGAVAALPFAVVAIMLVGGGLLGLFGALITLSGDRFTNALGRIGYGLLFAALTAGIFLIARLTLEDGEGEKNR